VETTREWRACVPPSSLHAVKRAWRRQGQRQSQDGHTGRQKAAGTPTHISHKAPNLLERKSNWRRGAARRACLRQSRVLVRRLGPRPGEPVVPRRDPSAGHGLAAAGGPGLRGSSGGPPGSWRRDDGRRHRRRHHHGNTGRAVGGPARLRAVGVFSEWMPVNSSLLSSHGVGVPSLSAQSESRHSRQASVSLHAAPSGLFISSCFSAPEPPAGPFLRVLRDPRPAASPSPGLQVSRSLKCISLRVQVPWSGPDPARASAPTRTKAARGRAGPIPKSVCRACNRTRMSGYHPDVARIPGCPGPEVRTLSGSRMPPGYLGDIRLTITSRHPGRVVRVDTGRGLSLSPQCPSRHGRHEARG
jgi:hypothetical protein